MSASKRLLRLLCGLFSKASYACSRHHRHFWARDVIVSAVIEIVGVSTESSRSLLSGFENSDLPDTEKTSTVIFWMLLISVQKNRGCALCQPMHVREIEPITSATSLYLLASVLTRYISASLPSLSFYSLNTFLEPEFFSPTLSYVPL